jgi:hypothetical protein
MPRKIFGWVAAAYLGFYVAHHPAEAALTMKNLGSGVALVATRFGDFFAALTTAHSG